MPDLEFGNNENADYFVQVDDAGQPLADVIYIGKSGATRKMIAKILAGHSEDEQRRLHENYAPYLAPIMLEHENLHLLILDRDHRVISKIIGENKRKRTALLMGALDTNSPAIVRAVAKSLEQTK